MYNLSFLYHNREHINVNLIYLSFYSGITPLFLAARGGKVSLVRELLRKKADPNCRGAAQLIAPLHWAAHKENVDIALLLIEYGGDIQLKDKEGRTPLTLASPDLSAKMIGKENTGCLIICWLLRCVCA